MLDARTLRAHIGRMIMIDGYRGGTLTKVAEDDETIVGLVEFKSGDPEWVDALDITLIF